MGWAKKHNYDQSPKNTSQLWWIKFIMRNYENRCGHSKEFKHSTSHEMTWKFSICKSKAQQVWYATKKIPSNFYSNFLLIYHFFIYILNKISHFIDINCGVSDIQIYF